MRGLWKRMCMRRGVRLCGPLALFVVLGVVAATTVMRGWTIRVAVQIDGRIYAAARQNNRTFPARRAFAISMDGGESFTSGFRPVDGLSTTPAVQGATLRLRAADQHDRYNRILLSSPVHESLRKNMTIFSSFDEGTSWVQSMIITESRAGYSDMVNISRGRIGLLYEGGAYPGGDARDEIRFASFTEAQLGIPR